MVLQSLQRLSTFAKCPMPGDAYAGITNFASKAANAHFERTDECVDDEVVCKSCGVSYKNWKNESPAAVHRTISPKCPAMNPSASSADSGSESSSSTSTSSLTTDLSSLQHNPYLRYLPDHLRNKSAALQSEEPRTPERASDDVDVQELPADHTPEHPSYSSGNRQQGAEGVRRVLFPKPGGDHPGSDTNQSADANESEAGEPHNTVSVTESPPQPQSSVEQPYPPRVLDLPAITHPFQTKSGGYDTLFASNRLKTFPGPTSSVKHQTWAEEGFVYREETDDLMCVYCGTVMIVNGHQPKVAHAKACPSCPFVMCFDVGNISLQTEKDIRLKYFEQQAAKKQLEPELMILKYPHYEKEGERLGSFADWPIVLEKVFPSKLHALAGFFYKGPIDKVACYCCGVELYKWKEDADVWRTHARVSPTCLHVISHKGQEFINEAASIKIMAEVIYPGHSKTGSMAGNSSVVTKGSGSCNLDLAAIEAALACGYTLPQIQHAILKFFRMTSRYPNEAILKASMKAADENHITICKQQQAIHQRDSELERKEKDVQQSHVQLQHKDTQLLESHAQLQQKDSQLQQKDSQLQRVLQEKEQIAQEKEQIAQEKEQIAQEKNAQRDQLNQHLHQLQMQDEQIQSLMQQVQQLRADRQVRVQPGPAGDAADHSNHHLSLVCKICMLDKPRMIFLPCGHLFSCAECTSRLPDRRCPVCRQDISQVLPAFVA